MFNVHPWLPYKRRLSLMESLQLIKRVGALYRRGLALFHQSCFITVDSLLSTSGCRSFSLTIPITAVPFHSYLSPGLPESFRRHRLAVMPFHDRTFSFLFLSHLMYNRPLFVCFLFGNF